MEKPTKSQFQAYLAGHAEAQRFIEAERDQRLAKMTPAEAREQFDALCELLTLQPPRNVASEGERVSFLVERRRVLDLLSTRHSP